MIRRTISHYKILDKLGEGVAALIEKRAAAIAYLDGRCHLKHP